MGMGMEMVRPRGMEDLPCYKRGPMEKPRKVALVVPHTNELPAAHPFRRALAERLMQEGIQVGTSEEKDMMERGWEARRKIDAELKKRFEKRLDELAKITGCPRIEPGTLDWRDELDMMDNPLRKFRTFSEYAFSAMLSMDDYVRRAKLIGECMAAGNDVVVELHAMNPEAHFGRADIERGLRRIGGAGILFAPSAMKQINAEFLAIHSLLAENANIAQAAYELSGIIGMDVGILFIGYFQARERVRQLGGRTAQVEVASERVNLPSGHQMYPYYRDELRSEFENAYCACTREPDGFSPADIEAVAWALGAIERRAK